jgi:hypothetical protein
MGMVLSAVKVLPKATAAKNRHFGSAPEVVEKSLPGPPLVEHAPAGETFPNASAMPE